MRKKKEGKEERNSNYQKRNKFFIRPYVYIAVGRKKCTNCTVVLKLYKNSTMAVK